MTLGSQFPAQFRKLHITGQLQPGTVIKFNAVMDDGKVHERRFLVLSVDAQTITFVINSEISDYIRRRPVLLRCQVGIDAGAHPFMLRDSHIDCSHARRYAKEGVVSQLMGNPAWVLGKITEPVRQQVLSAIKFSPGLSPVDAAELCASLSAAVLT